MKSTFALLVVLATCCSTAAAQRNESIPVTDVTISDLVSNPDFYSNVVVRVRGASVLRFEGEFICESPDEIDNEKGHCVWLKPVAKDGILGPLDPDMYHNKVVLLTGVFDKDYRAIGRMSGAIAPIHSVVIGQHTKGDIPPAPKKPSANNSFKPSPLRGLVQVLASFTCPRPQSGPA